MFNKLNGCLKESRSIPKLPEDADSDSLGICKDTYLNKLFCRKAAIQKMNNSH